jgi:hypothetical protein
LSEALGLGAVVLMARICGLATRHADRAADLKRKGASFDAMAASRRSAIGRVVGCGWSFCEGEAIVVTDSRTFKVGSESCLEYGTP